MSGILLIALSVVILAPAALVALVVYAIRFRRSRAARPSAQEQEKKTTT